MKAIYLNCSEIKSKEELHEVLSSLLNLPEYYGKNLDALHDVLTDISTETEINILGADSLKESLGRYAENFFRVLKDSAEENEKLSVKL